MNNINLKFPNINQYSINTAPSKTYGSNSPKFNTGQPIQDVFIPSVKKTDENISFNEVKELYDTIYEKYKDELSNSYGGIEIIKPKLRQSDKIETIGYCYNNNAIDIPTFMLNATCITRKNSQESWQKNIDGFEKFYAEVWESDPKEVQEALKEDPALTIATRQEKMAIIASSIRHELEHCAQAQCSLCADNTKEDFIKSVAEDFDVSEKDLEFPEIRHQIEDFVKDVYPFIYYYEPKTKIDENSNIAKLKDVNLNYNDFKQDFLKPTDSLDTKEYYSNTNEILARQAEVEFWENDAKEFFPEISEEFIKIQKLTTNLNKLNGAILRKQLNAQNNVAN